MIKWMLNTHKFNNYAFFCPVSRLHLTVSSPVGFTNEVTPAILKALKAKTILDVDGVVDIETGTVKAEKQATEEKSAEQAPEQNKVETKAEPVKVEEPKEAETEVEEPTKEAETEVEEPTKEAEVEEKITEDKQAKKTGKKAAAKADAE